MKWNLFHKNIDPPVSNGDMREVTLPVKVICEWSDEIIAEYDYENDVVLEYTSGYVMKVLPDQSFVYTEGMTTRYLASCFMEKSCKRIHREGESCTLNNNCRYPDCLKE